jgi:hypothetical protein
VLLRRQFEGLLMTTTLSHQAGDRLDFTPDLAVVGRFPATATIPALAEEVGVHSASPAFVRTHCGPLANQVLDAVPESFYAEADALGLLPNIDVRIHRLYPKDFPAYPGWHCDGEYRADYQSQPDLTHVQRHHHLVGTLSSEPGGVSLTEFVSSPVSLALTHTPDAQNTLWGQVHAAINGDPTVQTVSAQDGQLMQFDSLTLHRARPATVRGWRLFVRVSMWHKDYLGDGGRISRQEQVYQLAEGHGW